ncbi:MAG: hypothetical protein FWG92_06770 [Leptospirales bacterium]|nr:hypothetical protein [Leptospirales bacterium]
MFKRRKILVDKKLQLKSVYVIFAVSALSIALISSIMVAVWLRNASLIEKSLEGLNNAIATEKEIVNSFLEYKVSGSGFAVRDDAVKSDHEQSIKLIMEHVASLESSVKDNMRIVFISIGIFVLQCLFFCFYMIRFTHRIAGPAYIMAKYIKEMAEGKNPDIRPLRSKDELNELHKNLAALADRVK